MKRTFQALLLLSTIIASAQLENPFDLMDIEQRFPAPPQSPDVAAFMKYGDIPVNLYVGTPQVSIPVTTIQGHEVSLPISISYDASGVKVDQLATKVGLNWSLNYGGVVSRRVLGLPDQALTIGGPGISGRPWDSAGRAIIDYAINNQMTLFAGHNTVAGRNLMKNYYEDYLDNVVDIQADLFPFNVNGLSGTIVVDYSDPDANGNFPAFCIEHPDIRVETFFSGGNFDSWVITDTNGTRYTFQERELTKQDISEPSVQGGGQNVREYEREHVNAWYLTDIDSANGLDSFHFDYTRDGYWHDPINSEFKSQSQVSYLHDCGNGNQLVTNEQVIGWNYLEISQPSLEKITYNGSEVFSAETAARDDISGSERYTRFVNRDMNGNVVDYFELDNDHYFKKSPTSPNSRLQLKGAKIYRGDPSSAKRYVFEYTSDYIPNRGEDCVDFWGYSRATGGASGTGTNLIPAATHWGMSIPGINRDPVFLYAKRGTLEEIHYPTGGSTTFVYEEHDNFDPTYPEGTKVVNGMVGGLRLKEQVDDPGDGGAPTTRRYIYNDINALAGGDPQNVGTVVASNYQSSGIPQQQLNFWEEKIIDGDNYTPEPCLERFFQYASNASSQAPHDVTYGSVSEVLFRDGGFVGATVTEFYNQQYDGIQPNPVRPEYNRNLLNGEVKRSLTYNADLEVQRIRENTMALDSVPLDPQGYAEYTGIFFMVDKSGSNGCLAVNGSSPGDYSFLLTPAPPGGCTGGQGQAIQYYKLGNLNKYGFKQFWKRPLRSVTHIIEGSLTLSDTIEYGYGNNHHMATTVTNTDSRGVQQQVTVYYPGDAVGSGHYGAGQKAILDTMVLRNAISEKVLVEKQYGGLPVSTSKKFYGFHGNGNDIIRTDSVQASNRGSFLETRRIVHSYDGNGNPTEVSEPDGSRTHYLWGYHGKYLIAEIRNRTQAINTALFQDAVDASDLDVDRHTGTEDTLMGFLATIRSTYTKSLVTTYTHDPGIGMTSMTDPRGRTTTYDYDHLNRPSGVRDNEGNILGENEYSYRINN